MAKVNRVIKDGKQKEFIKTFDKLTSRYSSWQVWADFVSMEATAISNAIDKVHYEKREAMYMSIIKKYTKDEANIFPELLGIVVKALEENPEQDFLGKLYMNLNLGNRWKGQFFTPYDVCKMMAQMNTDNIIGEIEEKGCLSVGDQCCGAGALLIAYANAVCEKTRDSKYNWQNHILFIAQDVDMVTGLMCYIQLSLLGCAGYVKIGNTLTEPITESEALANLSKPDSCYWYTPMYFSDVWQWRRAFQTMDYFTRAGAKPQQNQVGPTVQREKTIAPKKSSRKDVTDQELFDEVNGQFKF